LTAREKSSDPSGTNGKGNEITWTRIIVFTDVLFHKITGQGGPAVSTNLP
jgi:hypothetical protein